MKKEMASYPNGVKAIRYLPITDEDRDLWEAYHIACGVLTEARQAFSHAEKIHDFLYDLTCARGLIPAKEQV